MKQAEEIISRVDAATKDGNPIPQEVIEAGTGIVWNLLLLLIQSRGKLKKRVTALEEKVTALEQQVAELPKVLNDSLDAKIEALKAELKP